MSRFRAPRAGLALPALLALASASWAATDPSPGGAGRVDLARVSDESATGDQWLLNGRTFAGTRFSPLAQIDRNTVDRLGLAWEFRDFVVRGRTHRVVEANPIFVDGVLYFPGPWGVAYAVDARTGRSLWTYDPKADGMAARASCCDAANRGLAVWQGRVYTASLDGYLVALDARTGQVIWRVDTFIDRTKDYASTGAPQIAGDKILLGNAGADMGTRGYVSAYDAATGRLVWRFFATPGDPRKGPDETPEVSFARKSWSPDARWDLGGGGAPWDSMAYDPALDIAYLGFGNGGPFPAWVRSPGGGDTLFTSSIVAVDAATGHLKWYYQETPRDSWDYDATSPMILADIPWQGAPRKLLLQAPKNGIFYVLDRATGELLKADPFTTVTWTDGVDLKTGRPRVSPRADYSAGPRIVSPGAPGGHAWQPISLDPDTGLVYLSVTESAMKYQQSVEIKAEPGAMFKEQGVTGEFPPFTAPADLEQLRSQPVPRMETRLTAWDPAQGKAVWRSAPLTFLAGGVLTTAGGLVFEGTAAGDLTAYDAASGKVLKRLQIGTGIMGAPISYLFDGVQYVAVMAGSGGPQGAAWSSDVAAARYQNFERLLVFRLDGGIVPLPPPVTPPAAQPSPAPIAAGAAVLTRGRLLFEDNCQRCHLVGGAFGEYPNLWNMPPEVLDQFESIVEDGALRDAGMASFADHLSRDDVAAIKSFIVTDELAKRRDGAAAGAHSRAASH